MGWFFVTECQRHPFQTNCLPNYLKHFFRRWLMIFDCLPTNACFWKHTSAFTFSILERISLEVTMVPLILRKLPGETERSPDIFMGFTGFYVFWEDVLLVFFPSKMQLNRGFEEVNWRQPGLQKALEFVRARQLCANFHPTALKDGMGKMRKLMIFLVCIFQGWSVNAKRCQVERHW